MVRHCHRFGRPVLHHTVWRLKQKQNMERAPAEGFHQETRRQVPPNFVFAVMRLFHELAEIYLGGRLPGTG